MPHDVLAPSASSSQWRQLAQAFGEGQLPPPCFALRVRPCGGGPSIDTWSVRSFVLTERLHAPYALRLAVVADADVEPDALLGARVELDIRRGESTRAVRGVVLESDLLGQDHDEPGLRLHVGPALALLGFYRRSRIFQGKTVPEIVRDVAEPLIATQGSVLVLDRLALCYAPRDYCVQYRETDLDFVMRILAEDGITVLFDHAQDAERVVLVDGNEALPFAACEPLQGAEVTSPPSLPFVTERADELLVETIRTLRQRSRLHRRRWSATAWDWKGRPPARLRSDVGLDDDEALGGAWVADEGRPDEGEGSDGTIEDPTPGQRRIDARRDRATGVELHATSNATILRAGSVFELHGAPQDGYAETWVVMAIRHYGEAPHVALGATAEDASVAYSNEFEAQPSDVPVVPPRPPRPHAELQTAVVTGPQGEVVHTDRFGRVRVRMHWDDAPHEGDVTSCWLRVAMPWAGDDFGMVFLPRVGTEVVVSFIDGDPDRPLCVGGVFNGGAMPPYDLPGGKTRTVLRTQSTDGEGYSELSFDDASGAEEVYLHAQRNLREHVRGEHSTYVEQSRRSVVCASRSTAIGKDDVLSVTGDQQESITGDANHHIKGAYRLRVSEAPRSPMSDRGMTTTVEHGTYEVDAADAVVLRCGESRIELHKDQIVITSPQIVLRSSVAAEPHPTQVTLARGGIEVEANDLHERVVVARTEADRSIALEVGPEAAHASLHMAKEATTLDAVARLEVASSDVKALGRESLVLDGASTGIHGQQVSIDAETKIAISTPGRVEITGHEHISLN
jgi:type VI secretion system secreted protein VgrG